MEFAEGYATPALYPYARLGRLLRGLAAVLTRIRMLRRPSRTACCWWERAWQWGCPSHGLNRSCWHPCFAVAWPACSLSRPCLYVVSISDFKTVQAGPVTHKHNNLNRIQTERGRPPDLGYRPAGGNRIRPRNSALSPVAESVPALGPVSDRAVSARGRQANGTGAQDQRFRSATERCPESEVCGLQLITDGPVLRTPRAA